MNNFTESKGNCVRRDLKYILHFILFILFFSQYVYSQSPTRVSISSSSEVGCQKPFVLKKLLSHGFF